MLGTYQPLAPAGALFHEFLHVGFAEQVEEATSGDLKSNQQTHAAASDRRLRQRSFCIAEVEE